MKKFLIVILLLVSILGLVIAEGVEDIDGFDWVTWSVDQKIGYLLGFYSAYSSLWERMVLENEIDVTQENQEMLEEYFYIPMTVEELGIKIDDYYSDYDNRKSELYMVVMFFAGKDYWNSGEFQERSSSQPDNHNS